MATKFAEVVYENGDHAIVSYDNESALIGGLQEQHRRAVNGEPGGPTGHAASRVKEVLTYDKHPGDYGEGGIFTADELKSATDAIIDKASVGGNVSAWDVISGLREYMTALKDRAELHPHDSYYKMDETGTLTLDLGE